MLNIVAITKEFPSKKQYIKINKGKLLFKADARLTLLTFEDHKHIIKYFPALDLSSYGDSDAEAMEMLTIVLEDFFECFAELPPRERIKELKKYGWDRATKYSDRKYSNNVYIDSKGILKNFNLPQETVVKEEVVTM